MRNGLPTLFWPLNNFSFKALEITATRPRPSSWSGFQPWPYLNGASNMVKKSLDA
ncbi:hypothetical protein D9M71_827910 [compost metagenome]